MPNIPLARRRELLLDAGVRVIARSGVVGATTRAVVTEAGMPLASFHYAFASHEDFLLRLVERELVPAPPPMPQAATFPEAVQEFVEGLLAQDATDNGIVAELALVGVQRDGLREATARRMAEYDLHLAEALDGLAAGFGMEWTIPTARLAPQVNAWRLGSVVQDAYLRRGAWHVEDVGAREFSAMLACAAGPLSGGAGVTQ